MNKQLEFESGTSITFQDNYERDNYSKSNIVITKYFNDGKAVYIKLDVREVKCLAEKIKELGI